MVERLSISHFQGMVGESFRVITPVVPDYSLTLEKVLVIQVDDRFETFSLLFSGPDSSFLPQATYTLELKTAGVMDLFLVPVAKTGSRYEYEAVFNRIKQDD